MEPEQILIMLLACGVIVAILTCAFVSLLRNYAKVKKENRLYRKFLEQQYNLESDYLDAYGKLMWESIYASTQTRRKTY